MGLNQINMNSSSKECKTTKELSLGINAMDEKHDDFLEILALMKTSPRGDFLILFKEMILQTQEHFAFEEDLMDIYDYHGRQEHLLEHQKLLNEMNYFYEKSKMKSPLGDVYIKEYVYDKFQWHVTHIDAQLAMYLKEKNLLSVS